MMILSQGQEVFYQDKKGKILGFMSDGKICIEVCREINNDCLIIYVGRDEIEINSTRIS